VYIVSQIRRPCKFLGVLLRLLRSTIIGLRVESVIIETSAMKAAAPFSVDVDVSSFPSSLVYALESRTFERAPAIRVLLAYLWQHRDEPLSEYAIATEALGRSPLFDAKIDATVRVQISRLRQRLDKYYEEEGASQPERIVIPLGSHQIRTEPAACRAASPAATTLQYEPGRQIGTEQVTIHKRPRTIIYLACACALLTLACIGLSIALLSRPSTLWTAKTSSHWVPGAR
jgi:hypothetical protein